MNVVGSIFLWRLQRKQKPYPGRIFMHTHIHIRVHKSDSCIRIYVYRGVMDPSHYMMSRLAGSLRGPIPRLPLDTVAKCDTLVEYLHHGQE